MATPLIYTVTIQSNLQITARVSNRGATMSAQLDAGQLETLVTDIDTAITDPQEPVQQQETLRHLGTRLYESLFTGDLRGQFRHLVQETLVLRDSGPQILLRICFYEGVPSALLRLPCELLYMQEEDGGIHLGTDSRFCLSYGKAEPSFYATCDLCDTTMLRVLFVHQHPRDCQGVVASPIEKHLQQLRSIANLQLENHADLQPIQVKEKLKQFKPHIVHFLCHGELDQERGFFLFCDEDGKRYDYTQDSFADLFSHHRPQAVVLHACHSGQVPEHNARTGGALRMVYRNIPAVLAMRYQIIQQHGWDFFLTFYQELARTKRLDVAAQAGREQLAIKDRQTLCTPSSLSPVLWMNRDEGWLFPPGIEDLLDPFCKELLTIIQYSDQEAIFTSYADALPKRQLICDRSLPTADYLKHLWECKPTPLHIAHFIERYAAKNPHEQEAALGDILTRLTAAYPDVFTMETEFREALMPDSVAKDNVPFLLVQLMPEPGKSGLPEDRFTLALYVSRCPGDIVCKYRDNRLRPLSEHRSRFCVAFKQVTADLPDDVRCAMRIEFIIPTPLLTHEVEQWALDDDDLFVAMLDCGHNYPTVVRPLERVTKNVIYDNHMKKWELMKQYDPVGPPLRWISPEQITSAERMRSLFLSDVEHISLHWTGVRSCCLSARGARTTGVLWGPHRCVGA